VTLTQKRPGIVQSPPALDAVGGAFRPQQPVPGDPAERRQIFPGARVERQKLQDLPRPEDLERALEGDDQLAAAPVTAIEHGVGLRQPFAGHRFLTK